MYSMRLRFILGIIGIFVILIISFLLFLIVRNSFHLANSKNSTVTIDNHAFSVEVVKTVADQEKGLSGRNSLGQNNGMLFLFNHPDIYAFWMRNMKFPLDIIYIRNKKIVNIYKNIPTVPSNTDISNIPQVKPSQPADSVLEINAGYSQKYNFKEGDSVNLSL